MQRTWVEELAIVGEAGPVSLKETCRGINLIVAWCRSVEYQSTEKWGSLIPMFTERVALISSFWLFTDNPQ